MPSHTVASAMIQLYHDGCGAPWAWPTWIELTGVKHGLFHDDPSKLPLPWTQKNAEDVASYFSQYNAKLKEEDKIKFSAALKNSGDLPGRALWRIWIVKMWARCHIHDIIKDVLSTRGVHPIQLMVADNRLDVWPPGPSYIPLVIDDVCCALFGAEALNSLGMVPFDIRSALHALIQRTWGHIHKTTKRDKDLFIKLTKVVEDSFLDLNRDRPSRIKIRHLIGSVAKWKSLALLFGTNDILTRIEVIENDLEGLMGILGAQIGANASKNVLSKQAVKLLESLASEQNVKDLIAFYRDCFAEDDSIYEFEPLLQEPNLGIAFAGPTPGGDPGVEAESMLDVEIMKKNLGLRMGVPLLFNHLRHKSGLPMWSDERAACLADASANTNPDLETLALHYHQIVGIHACMRLVFSENPSTCTGVLLADDVGLGKTFQSLSFIALMASAAFAQLHGHTMSPIIASRKYLGDSTVIPNLSHLIVVPGTLMSQWETEAKTAFRYGSVDILLYRGGKARANFWGNDGLYAKSRHSPCHIIIIASSSAVQNDFNEFFQYSKSRKSSGTPWDTPPKHPQLTDARMNSNLFGRQYLTVTRDEAQDCRNVGAKHVAMLALLQLGSARLILTATPLQTSTKDVASMGRLVGIPHFLSEDAVLEEKDDGSTLRQAKSSEQDSEDALRNAQVLIASRMQTQFQGRVIRRTVESKNQNGVSLIGLPPCVPVTLVIDLTPREMETIVQLSKKVADSVSDNNAVKKLGTKGFYLEYRMAVGFVLCDGEIPVFQNLSQWEPVKSTKIDVCSRICKHLLQSDDAAMVYTENGSIIFPSTPDSRSSRRDRKILIYQEFTSLSELLHNILGLYGVESAAINGDTTFEQRARIVERFVTGDGPRVLIISAVGGIGLNLSCADTVIFLDQPWSAQDVRQIRGRVHRQPQRRTVSSIHLLASGTADILLSEMAEGKKDMLEAFLSKDNELRTLLCGKSIPTDDSESDVDEPQVPKRSRKRARRDTVIDDIDETALTASIPSLTTENHGTGNDNISNTMDTKAASGLNVSEHNNDGHLIAQEDTSGTPGQTNPGQDHSAQTIVTTLSTPVHVDKTPVIPTDNSETDTDEPHARKRICKRARRSTADESVPGTSSQSLTPDNHGTGNDDIPNTTDTRVASPEIDVDETSIMPTDGKENDINGQHGPNQSPDNPQTLVQITTASALAEIRARPQGQLRQLANTPAALLPSAVLQNTAKANTTAIAKPAPYQKIPPHRQSVEHAAPLSPPPIFKRANTNPGKRRR